MSCFCRAQAAETALDQVDSWPQFTTNAYERNPELRTKDAFLAFLEGAVQRFSNHSATDWLDMVQFYSTAARSLAGHTTVEMQTRGKQGYWSKMHAVNCVLWSLASLLPVRAIGVVFFCGGTKLASAERAAYLSYRRRVEDSLACGVLFSPEIGRQRAVSLSENAEFWQSLDALTDMVDSNIPANEDRLVKLEINCAERGICPIAKSTMTELSL